MIKRIFRKHQAKIILLMPLILILIFIIIGLAFLRAANIEQYCLKQNAHVYDGLETIPMFTPTPEEYRFISPDREISLGFREELKCERNQKFFYIF